jgi:hypothetical protein
VIDTGTLRPTQKNRSGGDGSVTQDDGFRQTALIAGLAMLRARTFVARESRRRHQAARRDGHATPDQIGVIANLQVSLTPVPMRTPVRLKTTRPPRRPPRRRRNAGAGDAAISRRDGDSRRRLRSVAEHGYRCGYAYAVASTCGYCGGTTLAVAGGGTAARGGRTPGALGATDTRVGFRQAAAAARSSRRIGNSAILVNPLLLEMSNRYHYSRREAGAAHTQEGSSENQQTMLAAWRHL